MNNTKKQELMEKVERFGLSDLRKLAPIGDLWYANGWENGGIEQQIMKAFREQGFHFDKGRSHGWAGTDHESYCTELGLTMRVDSSG